MYNVAMSIVNVGCLVNNKEMQDDFKKINSMLDSVMWKFRVSLSRHNTGSLLIRACVTDSRRNQCRR